MGEARKRRRKLFVLIILTVVMVWIGGCTMGQSPTLSSLTTVGIKPVANGVGSEEGPQKVNGTEDDAGNIIVGNTNSSGDDTIHNQLDEKKPDPAVPNPIMPSIEEKRVSLTFDDGPDTRYTTAILDILKEKEVKATFFVVGQQVKKNPDVLKRIVDEGHTIGNHTYSHKDMSKLNEEHILKELLAGDAVIKEVLGFTPTLFRAPYGAVSDTLKKVLNAQKRELIGWTIDTRDWAGTSAVDMQQMIKKEAKPGSMILMHSFGSKHIMNTVQALPDIIDDLKGMGYTMVTVEQNS